MCICIERERVYSSGGGGKRLFSIEGKKKAATGEVYSLGNLMRWCAALRWKIEGWERVSDVKMPGNVVGVG